MFETLNPNITDLLSIAVFFGVLAVMAWWTR
jgi:hypothetical protein